MKTILVVDDDDAILEALTEFLAEEGYRAVAAANAKDGLAQLVKETPDLVLTDSVMPVLDGPSFVQCVHALPEFRSLPVVMMSASTEGVALSARTIGVAAILKKPFGLDELLSVIERLIGDSELGTGERAAPSHHFRERTLANRRRLTGGHACNHNGCNTVEKR